MTAIGCHGQELTGEPVELAHLRRPEMAAANRIALTKANAAPQCVEV